MTLTLIALLEADWSQAFTPWTLDWLPQTIGSMLVGITCGVLGCFVVLRRMALIGDALSHAILPGVVIALIVFGAVGASLASLPLWLLAGALLSGLATAGLINLVHRRSRTKEDSAIGIAFTAMFAIGLILIADLPRGTHFDLRCFIYGDPLAFNTADLWMMGTICPLVLLTVALLYHRLKLISFDPVVAAAMGVSVALFHYLLMAMLAATIVAGIKATGVILVVAMVITPASAAYQLTNRLSVMLVLAGLIGAVSAGLGMSMAFVVNTPTGPAMVIIASLIFVLAVLFSPGHGYVFDRIRRARLARHVAAEDMLKFIYRQGPLPRATWLPTVGGELGIPRGILVRAFNGLIEEQLVKADNGELILTDAGKAHAEELVRAHRLWETYLVDKAGVAPEDVHHYAEELEHAHDLSELLDDTLGRPATDPHGSEIPRG